MPYDATDFIVAPVKPEDLTTPAERLMYLRNFLRELPAEQFNMAFEGSIADAELGSCGTPACIMGWGRAVFRDRRYTEIGTSLLGLDHGAMSDLFFPGDYLMADGVDPYDATPADAADVLDHLIRTGEVDWSVARAAR